MLFLGSVTASIYNDERLRNYRYTGVCDYVNHGVFEFIGECDKYVLCLFKRELVVICPTGKIFNSIVKDCVDGDPGSCSGTTEPTIPPITTTEPITTTISTQSTTRSTEPPTEPTTTSSTPSTTTSTEPITTTTSTTTQAPPSTPNWRDDCGPGDVGLKPLDWSCKFYLFCFNSIASLRECRSGQIFYKTKCVEGDENTCEPLYWGDLE